MNNTDNSNHSNNSNTPTPNLNEYINTNSLSSSIQKPQPSKNQKFSITTNSNNQDMDNEELRLIELKQKLRDNKEIIAKQQMKENLRPKIQKEIYTKEYKNIYNKIKNEIESNLLVELNQKNNEDIQNEKKRLSILEKKRQDEIANEMIQKCQNELDEEISKESQLKEKEIKLKYMQQFEAFKKKLISSTESEYDKKKKELTKEIDEIKSKIYRSKCSENLKLNKINKLKKTINEYHYKNMIGAQKVEKILYNQGGIEDKDNEMKGNALNNDEQLEDNNEGEQYDDGEEYEEINFKMYNSPFEDNVEDVNPSSKMKNDYGKIGGGRFQNYTGEEGLVDLYNNANCINANINTNPKGKENSFKDECINNINKRKKYDKNESININENNNINIDSVNVSNNLNSNNYIQRNDNSVNLKELNKLIKGNASCTNKSSSNQNKNFKNNILDTNQSIKQISKSNQNRIYDFNPSQNELKLMELMNSEHKNLPNNVGSFTSNAQNIKSSTQLTNTPNLFNNKVNINNIDSQNNNQQVINYKNNNFKTEEDITNDINDFTISTKNSFYSLYLEKNIPTTVSEFGKYLIEHIEKEENYKIQFLSEIKKLKKNLSQKLIKDKINDHCLIDYMIDLWEKLDISFYIRYQILKQLLKFRNSQNVYLFLDRETEYLTEYSQITEDIFKVIRKRENIKSKLQTKLNRGEILTVDKSALNEVTTNLEKMIQGFKNKYKNFDVIWKGLRYEWFINYENWFYEGMKENFNN